MGTSLALDLAIAAAVLGFAVAVWRVCRTTPREAAARDRIIRESCTGVHSIPANDPRLPAGINAHLDDYAALDPQLARAFMPGLDRLRQAIRDEQQKGDQK